MFAASPSPIMEAAFGRVHNGGPVAFGRRPTVVESIMGDGEAANTAKTYANMYQIFANLQISLKSPYVYPGAIHLARSGAPTLDATIVI